MRLRHSRMYHRRAQLRFVPGHSPTISHVLERRSLASLLAVSFTSLSEPLETFLKTQQDILGTTIFQDNSLFQAYLPLTIERNAVDSLGNPPFGHSAHTPLDLGEMSSVPVILSVAPFYNPNTSIPNHTTLSTTSNLSPLYQSFPLAFGQLSTVFYSNFVKGPSPTGTLSHGSWQDTVEQYDAILSPAPLQNSLGISFSDTVSLQQDVGKYKLNNLASAGTVDHMIFDLHVHDSANNLDYGIITGSVGYSGSLRVLYVSGADTDASLNFKGHGIEVTTVGDALSVIYSTSTGPQSYYNSTFFQTGGDVTIAFSGMTDAVKPYNDVQFTWNNFVALDDSPAGTSDSSQLHWSYTVAY